jgi:hypothetical protein
MACKSLESLTIPFWEHNDSSQKVRFSRTTSSRDAHLRSVLWRPDVMRLTIPSCNALIHRAEPSFARTISFRGGGLRSILSRPDTALVVSVQPGVLGSEPLSRFGKL